MMPLSISSYVRTVIRPVLFPKLTGGLKLSQVPLKMLNAKLKDCDLKFDLYIHYLRD